MSSNNGFASFDEWWEWWLLWGVMCDHVPSEMLHIVRTIAQEAYDDGHTAGYKDGYG